MPLLKEVPREVKEGKKREKEWVRRLWMKKNWKWVLLGCSVLIVLLVFVIISMTTQMQQRACFFVYDQPERVTEIRVESGKCNSKKNTVLDLSGFKNLKKLVIQKRSFQKVREIKIHGLENLTEVFINDLCFNEIPKRSANSNFMVFHCPKLQIIKVGRGSLSRLQSCFIHENPSLKTIRWGDGSFENCEFFYLKGSLMLTV